MSLRSPRTHDRGETLGGMPARANVYLQSVVVVSSRTINYIPLDLILDFSCMIQALETLAILRHEYDCPGPNSKSDVV